MTELISSLTSLNQVNILVVGDVMLDYYVYGTVERISPEAPIPILKIQKDKKMPGGAANVMANLSALGVNSSLIGVCGNDTYGDALISLLEEMPNVDPQIVRSEYISTVTKTRYVSGSQQLLRTDVETPHAMPANMSDILLLKVIEHIDECDLVILSDYKKGVVTARLGSSIIDLALQRGIPVFVDPKGKDYNAYRKATLIKPNYKELKDLFANEDIAGNEAIYVRKMLREYEIEYCLLTLGKDGMKLITAEHEMSFPALEKEVFDVSGAGDTVIATLAAMYASGSSLEEACILSNIAGGVAVGKPGTATVSVNELADEMQLQSVDSVYPV